MLSYVNQKVLITTNNWFIAPDGKQYRAVHGTLKAVHESGKTLGFIPNRSHANWFIEIGEMIIMGCQVMYIVKTETVNTDDVDEWKMESDSIGKAVKYLRPTSIYLTS